MEGKPGEASGLVRVVRDAAQALDKGEQRSDCLPMRSDCWIVESIFPAGLVRLGFSLLGTHP